jgi:hypothetical protein
LIYKKRVSLKPANPRRRASLGPLAFEYSAFAVDGRPDLSMVIYNPATADDAEKISASVGTAPALERA